MKVILAISRKTSKESTLLKKHWKMAMVVTESEGGQKRHYTCMKDGEIPQAKSVKRRRRDSNACKTELIQQQGCYLTSVPKTVKRSSRFRGVSRHKWTGRYEAHLWDKLTWNVTQKKKGKQVYLGAYDDEEAAARAYDLAALKYWGTSTFTNFPISEHEKEIEIMQTATRQEYLATLRRKSSGISRGTSTYTGVARHHQNGKWEDRIGSVFGNKYLNLGNCSTQEEAARAYDMASIEYGGINAITNFDSTTNVTWLNSGKSNSFPVQERRASTEYEEALSSFCSGIKLHYSCSPAKSCRINATNTQQNYGRSTSFGSCRRSSSPTALDLLLRSSVFKELVEKNSNLSEKENNEENAKTLQQGMYSYIPFSYKSNNH